MLHIELMEKIESAFGATHVASITLCRDALEMCLSNGVELTVRVAGPREYAMQWRWGEAVMGIDTAPMHVALRTYPNHLHTPEGQAVDDPVTEIDAQPWDNVRALIDRLAADPLLGYEGSLPSVSCDASVHA